MEEKISIGSKMAYCRRKVGITQSQMANVLGVDAKDISNYERDIKEPSLEFLLQFSRCFEIPMEDFVNENFTLEDFRLEYPRFYFASFIQEYKMFWE